MRDKVLLLRYRRIGDPNDKVYNNFNIGKYKNKLSDSCENRVYFRLKLVWLLSIVTTQRNWKGNEYYYYYF